MASYRIRETFFRPDRECAREPSALPADIHNGLQLLVCRDGGRPVFLPIRTMQYQAIVDRDEVVFVDANGGYAHQAGEGGRLIRIAWLPKGGPRDSLAAPASCDIVYYFPGLKETQRRLVGEIRAALRLMLARQRDRVVPDIERRVLPFRRI
jgi:hypothetical protein